MKICSYASLLLRDQLMIERWSQATKASTTTTTTTTTTATSTTMSTTTTTTTTTTVKTKTLMTLELSQYSKSWSTFSSSVQVAASCYCSLLGNDGLMSRACAWKRPVFILACQKSPSCAGALLQIMEFFSSTLCHFLQPAPSFSPIPL